MAKKRASSRGDKSQARELMDELAPKLAPKMGEEKSEDRGPRLTARERAYVERAQEAQRLQEQAFGRPTMTRAAMMLASLRGAGPLMVKRFEEGGEVGVVEKDILPSRSEQALRAYIEAANPRVNVKKEPLRPGVVGAVRTTNPDRILLSSTVKQTPAETEEVILHELEHSLSERGGNPLGVVDKSDGTPVTTDNNYRFDILYNMKDKGVKTPSLGSLLDLQRSGEGQKKRLMMINNFVNNRRLIEQFFGRSLGSAYFNPNMLRAQARYGTEGALFAEQIADLSALEQITGKSLTRDKDMKKLLFPDDRSAEVYDAITGYRQTRLDARDLPPYTPISPEKKGMTSWLKDKLGMKEGGEVDLAEQMTVGTLPEGRESLADKKASELLRALAETGRGFVGVDPIERGSEAYRTGQALANMPAIGLAAGAVKGTGKLKNLTKKDIKAIAGELETSRGQLAEITKKYPQIREASVGEVEALTKGEPFTAYRGISLLPGRELRSETMPSTSLDPNVALGIIKDAPVMITKEGFITSTPVLRQYPGMKASETEVYVPSLIKQVRERQPGALEMKIPTRSGEKMSLEDIFEAVQGEKELLADVSKKSPKDILFNRYQGGVGDKYLMEVARKVLEGEWKGGEALLKEIGGYHRDPSALAKEFDDFAEMVKAQVLKKAQGGEVSNDEFIQQMTVGTVPDSMREPGKAEEMFRALVESGQGFLGLEPGRRGTEAYRTGQALSNLPVLAIPAAAVKGTGKAAEALKEVGKKATKEGGLKRFLEGSKIQEPMYHITPKDFDEFVPGGDNPLLSGPGIWMTPNKEFQPAAHNVYERSGEFRSGTNVMPLYASIKNPLVTRVSSWKEDFKPFGGGDPWSFTKDQAEKIQKAGYDGILLYGDKGNLEEAVAFKPNQVKSALGNEGTYDPKIPVITKAKGGEVSTTDFIRKRQAGSPPEGEVPTDDYIQQMMTGTPPSDASTNPGILPPELRRAIDVPLDFANMAVRGMAGMVAGPAYGLYKGVTGGKYGTPEGVQEASSEAGRMMQRITGEPKTETARDVMDFVQRTMEPAKIPFMPQFLTMPTPGPGTASALMRSYELAETPPVGAVKLPGKEVRPVATPQMDAMGLYSPTEQVVMNLPQEKGTAQQMLAQISKAPGSRAAELRATGLEEYLKGKGNAPVTRQEIQDFLKSNPVQVNEVVLGKGQVLSPEAKRRMGDAMDKMIEIDNELINAPYFRNVSTDDSVGDTLARLRGPLARKAAAGDAEAMAEIDALNLPPDIKQLVLGFGEQKNEYEKYSKQARKMVNPKFEQYNIPGGENAREIYLTLPPRPVAPTPFDKSPATMLFERDMMEKYGTDSFPSTYNRLSPDEVDRYDMLVREDRNTAKTESMLRDKQTNYTVPLAHRVSPEADTNRLAHIFLDDRTDAEGNKVLFVQELQSDWAQQGRNQGFKSPEELATKKAKLADLKAQFDKAIERFEKAEAKFNNRTPSDNDVDLIMGMRRANDEADLLRQEIVKIDTGGLPSAPFVTSTEDWINLALKRVIKEAVDTGADNVAFIKGEQAAKKYRLSTVLDGIEVSPTETKSNTSRLVELKRKDGGKIPLYVNENGVVETVAPDTPKEFKGKPLSEVIGKEMAEKVMSVKRKPGKWESTIFNVEDMEVGGQGMKGFYDNILPKTANKLLEKLGGGKVKTIELEKEIPSRLQNYASSFMDWMSTRHPEVSSEDAARAWAMGMDNNEFVKEYYEATKPVKYIGFDITPEMREMVKTKGLPKFAAGGEVTQFIKAHA